MKKFRRKLIHHILSGKEKDEDKRRSEYILNVILFSILLLSTLSLVVFVINSLPFLKNLDSINNRSTPINSIVLTAFFVSLFIFAKKGYFASISYVLISLVFFSGIQSAYLWGSNVPIGLLLFALAITLSGILLSTRSATLLSILSVTSLVVIGKLQIVGAIEPNLYWKEELFQLTDILVYGGILGVITAVSWLYNNEIKKSLKRARKSEFALKKERDLLEVKVNERTRELKNEQKKRISELYHFYEFGQLSGGIFHDLVSRLQGVYISIEKLSVPKKRKARLPDDIQAIIEEANQSLRSVKSYLHAAQKQIKQEDTRGYFSIVSEVRDSVEISSYKAKQSGTKIYYNEPESKMLTFGNIFKFNQIMTNIISNATDACASTKNANKPCSILIEVKKDKKMAVITVSDTGPGIDEGILDKIFNPFFTTKKTMGLGLFTTKNIIRKDFSGSINIRSETNKGTEVTVKLPLINE